MNSDELLSELTEMTRSRDAGAKEWGWKGNDYINAVWEEEKASGSNAPFRTVLTECLDHLSNEFANYMSRSTIADRVRVMRWFDKDTVLKYGDKPTFNHLRACYVSGEWPKADEYEIAMRVAYAIVHNWPSPEEIRNMGTKLSVSDEDRQWEAAQKAARRIVDNPLQSKYRRQAAGYVLTAECGEDGQWGADDAVQEQLALAGAHR